jgi:N-formylglutamate amidohydrolase
LRVTHQGFYEILGEGVVLLTAPHAGGPTADLLTGEIVEGVAVQSGCPGLVGNTSRENMDLNRAQAFDTGFRESIETLTQKNGLRLILDIHGKETRGVEIGTADGKTASKETTDVAVRCLSRYFQVEVNKKYKGLRHGSIITTHHRKDPQGSYLVEAIQMEFGLKERSTSRSKTVNGLAEIVNLVNRQST